MGGAYGLIADVSVTFTDLPISSEIDVSEIYNSWVDSQKIGYRKKEHVGTSYSCIIVKPEQINAILNSRIPKNAQHYNQNLVDTNFSELPISNCILS